MNLVKVTFEKMEFDEDYPLIKIIDELHQECDRHSEVDDIFFYDGKGTDKLMIYSKIFNDEQSYEDEVRELSYTSTLARCKMSDGTIKWKAIVFHALKYW